MNTFSARLSGTLLIGLLILLAIASCKKDPYEIGFDLLPPSDTVQVATTDTITVEAFSVRHDSVRTDRTSYLMLGSLQDPVFGKTTVGFYSQVRLTSEEVNFGTSPVLDSLVLLLFYKGYYGDTLTRQNVKVYEISEDLNYDSLRYSTQRWPTYPTLLADQDFIPRIKDSVTVNKVKVAPHLRINLSNLTHYLGNKILNTPEDALASNSAFLKFFKGLYVSASPVNSGGALLNFDLAGTETRLVVYFHNGTDPAKDSLSYDLSLNQGCARFLTVDHNGYLDASQDLKRQILNRDSAQGMHKLYLQGMGGVKIKLKFPYIKALAKNTIVAVNDAVLQLVNMENDTILSPPPSLTIVRQDSAGRVGYLVDENEGASYFGGVYNPTTRTYSFRLTQHLQNVLQGSYPNSFDLYMLVNSPFSSSSTPNRIMMFGSNPTDYASRMRLKVTYTLLNPK